MTNILERVQSLLIARKYDDACRALQSATPEEMATVMYFQATMHALTTFCASDHVQQAVTLVQKCPPELRKVFHLGKLVDSIVRRRRFDMAARALSGFGLENDAEYVSNFIGSLVAGGQFRLAVQWMEKLQVLSQNGAAKQTVPEEQWVTVFRWSPEVLVQCMIDAENYAEALKYMKAFNLTDRFKANELVNRLLGQSKISDALKYIKDYSIESQFSMEAIVEGMLAQKRWSDVEKLLVASPSLRNRFPVQLKFERMIKACDWLAVLDTLPQFKCYLDRDISLEDIPSENHENLFQVINGMMQDGAFLKAMELIIHFQLEKQFPTKDVINRMIESKQFCHALKYMKLLELENDFDQSVKDHIEESRRKDLIKFRRLFKLRSLQRREQMKAIDNESNLVFMKQTPVSISSTEIPQQELPLDIERTMSILNQLSMEAKSTDPSHFQSETGSFSYGEGGSTSESDDSDSDGDEILLLGSTSEASQVKPNSHPYPASPYSPRPPPSFAHSGPNVYGSPRPAPTPMRQFDFQSPPPRPRLPFQPPHPPGYPGQPFNGSPMFRGPPRGPPGPGMGRSPAYPFTPPRPRLPVRPEALFSPMVGVPRGEVASAKPTHPSSKNSQEVEKTPKQVDNESSLARSIMKVAITPKKETIKNERIVLDADNWPSLASGSATKSKSGKLVPQKPASTDETSTERETLKNGSETSNTVTDKKVTEHQPKQVARPRLMMPSQVLLARRKK